jgi:heme exporter protein C
MASLAATLTGLANPKRFLDLSGALIPWIAAGAVISFAIGLAWGLFGTPADYQQGQSVKIMFIHVPAAILSMFVYTVMAGASLTGLVFRHPLADLSAKAAAPLGAAFTVLALFTGSLWGKPTWGTYWVWDARLTSELILLFLYLGYIALWDAIEDPVRAARIAAILALVGAADVLIIHFSVEWWNTLHQPASILRPGGPSIDASFLWPLFVMLLAYTLLFVWLWLLGIRTEVFRRRARSLMLARGAGT